MARKGPLIPKEEDRRHDDYNYDPSIEKKSSKAWLNLLRESEKAFEEWNEHCDNIDRRYANLARLSDSSRQREYQMFWANAEVLKPSIYAKPPVPVVVPKFTDRRPIYTAASEVLERCATVSFDLADIDSLMKLVRDDLGLYDRGVAWCRYESEKDDDYGTGEAVCIDFKGRRDFLHSISRNWREVTWVAAASYLTRTEARDRFKPHSGDAYQRVEYKVDKDGKEVGGVDDRQRGKFWEIWDKSRRRVVWVAQGCDEILDEDEPHLKLRTFFPCPQPAYGTTQRGSLVPVPDVMQYEDQLAEVNTLTGRIHALSEAVNVKGFYPAGGAEIAEALQTAMAINTPGTLLVPISNWAAFGGSKDVIIWLPIDVIATTITALVTLRKQLIEDIYQIMGLSDIMRGATDPNETLGAQQLKSQYGSTRIRDKQQELVRVARDLVEISLDIIASEFDDKTIIAMSQTQLPTKTAQQQQLQELQQQVQQQLLQMQQQQAPQQPQQDPQQQQAPGQQLATTQQAPQQPDNSGQIQQLIKNAQAAAQNIMSKPTIEQVLEVIRSTKAKSFVLDIETDSTILADEQAEKQARTEFVQVLGGLLQQLSQMITAEPKTAAFCGEVLKFATAPFRAGRSLDGAIDELVEQMKAKSGEASADNPLLQAEQMKQQTAREKNQLQIQIEQAKLQQADQHKKLELQNDLMIERIRMGQNQQADAAKAQVQQQKMQESREAHQAHMIENQQKMQMNAQKSQMAVQQLDLKRQEMMNRAQDRRVAQQQRAQAQAMRQPPGAM